MRAENLPVLRFTKVTDRLGVDGPLQKEVRRQLAQLVGSEVMAKC